MRVCSLAECTRVYIARGFCDMHYQRYRRHGTPYIESPYERNGSISRPEYEVWKKMRHRCNIPTDKGYPNYGGRGIKVCERWQKSFLAFLGDMGSRPSDKHSLDRVDTNGNYSPENCRWATSKQQANNTRTNHLVTFEGATKTVREWCDEKNLKYSRVIDRLNKLHWSVEKAFGQ